MILTRHIKTLYLVLLLLLPFYVNAQVVSGRVYREGKDSLAIPQASIYYNGSLNGTSSDAHGDFKIQAFNNKIPLIVSCVGYYSTTVTNYKPGVFLKVALKPKVNELKGVTINSGRSKSREDMMKMFVREFLGTSFNANSCTITNPDDIDLHYSFKTRILTAFADKPILIQNNRLGYSITYYLDHFKKTDSIISYDGNFIFKDEATPDNIKKFSSNREHTYQGSRMQFIRALWSNTLDDHDYLIYTEDILELPVDKIVKVQDGKKYIDLNGGKIIILYHEDRRRPTSLRQVRPYCYIDKNGFNDDSLQWFGLMAIERVGDMLPYEYRSVKDKN